MPKLQKLPLKFDWVNLPFMVLTPIISILGMIWVFKNGGPHLYTWIMMPIMMYMTGIGITAGYHRLFSHRTYHAHAAIRIFYLLFGGACFEGSVREWCCAHRKHHRFIDTDKDPYNAKRGFFYSHIGWVCLASDQSDESNIKDLLKDPLVMWQDKYYVFLAAIVSFIIPTALGALWGDVWGALFLVGFTRTVLNLHFTFLINSWCHFVGKQTYSDSITARDSVLVSIPTYGEGYHNFHHTFEADYRNGVRWFNWDPTKWVIFAFSKTGLTWGLKRAEAHKILEARLKMDQKRFQDRFFQHDQFDELCKRTAAFRERVNAHHQRYCNLKKEYKALKQLKKKAVMDRLIEIQSEIQTSKSEFNKALANWHIMISQTKTIS